MTQGAEYEGPTVTVSTVDEATPHDPDAFVSYSRRDQVVIDRLVRDMETRGLDVWVDRDDIPASSRWRDELTSAITAAGTFVVTISPASMESEYCQRELRHAIELGKRIVPVLVADTANVPDDVSGHQYVFLREGDDWDSGVEQLAAAIRTDPDRVREHTRWLSAALGWEAEGRNRSMLVRGIELRAAETWLAAPRNADDPAITPLQTEFVHASRQGATRRLQALVASSAAAVLVAIALALVALVQRNTAVDREREARSRQGAALAIADLLQDPERSVVRAAAAVRLTRTQDADRALRLALDRSHVKLVLAGPADPAADAGLAPDGTQLAVARGNRIEVRSTNDGALVRMLDGHTAAIFAIDYSPDSLLLGSSAVDGTTVLWDTRTGARVSTLQNHTDPAGTLVFAGDRVATLDVGSGDRVVRLWEVASGRLVATLRGHDGSASAPAFSPDGRIVATPGEDGTVRTWSASDGAPIATLQAGQPVNRVAFSPDGRQIAAATGRFAVTSTLNTAPRPGFAFVWDVESGRLVQRLAGHDESVEAVAFRPGGTEIATGSADDTARIWNIATGAQRLVLNDDQDVSRVGFSPDGRQLFTASTGGSLAIWDSRVGRREADFLGNEADVLRAIASKDWRLILSTTFAGEARLWSVPSVGRPLEGASQATSGVINANGARVITFDDATRDGGGGTATVWDARSGSRRSDLDGARFITHAASSADGQRFAIGGFRGLTVLDAMTGRLIWSNAQSEITTVAFSSDRAALVTGGIGGRVRLWDAETGAIRAKLAHPLVSGVAAGPGGTPVLSTSNSRARVWDPKTGRIVAERSGLVIRAALSRDGRRAAVSSVTASGNAAEIIDTTSGRSVTTIRGVFAQIAALDLNGDGTRLVTASRSAEPIRIWDSSSGRLQLELRGHHGDVVSAHFSGDDRLIVSAGADGTARVWDAQSGEEITAFGGHVAGLNSAALSADGSTLLTADESGVALVHDCDVCGPLDALLSAVPRHIAPGAERRAAQTDAARGGG